MQKSMPENLKEKIDLIKKTEKPYGILLVGSSRKILEAPETANSDIDIFVIKENGPLEREVFYSDGVEYDISYISLSDLECAIEEQIHSLIAVLSKSEAVFLEPKADTLIKEIEKLYARGPRKKTEEYIRYNRFKLTKSLEVVQKRLDSVEFDFFLHNYLRELLTFYFESRGEWVPSEKRLIKSIDDQKLRDYVELLLGNMEREIKLKSLELMVDYIMEPIGGKLCSWDKSIYPFDFK